MISLQSHRPSWSSIPCKSYTSCKSLHVFTFNVRLGDLNGHSLDLSCYFLEIYKSIKAKSALSYSVVLYFSRGLCEAVLAVIHWDRLQFILHLCESQIWNLIFFGKKTCICSPGLIHAPVTSILIYWFLLDCTYTSIQNVNITYIYICQWHCQLFNPPRCWSSHYSWGLHLWTMRDTGFDSEGSKHVQTSKPMNECLQK